jgi:hypothetical protein
VISIGEIPSTSVIYPVTFHDFIQLFLKYELVFENKLFLENRFVFFESKIFFLRINFFSRE